MGIQAKYMEVDKYLLADFLSKSPNKRFDAIEDLEVGGKQKVLNLYKMWDALHYLLTGTSANKPIENNLYSEAVIGTQKFSENDTEFIAYIRPERLSKIVDVLDAFDIDKALTTFDPLDFAKKKIYPNIWQLISQYMAAK